MGNPHRILAEMHKSTNPTDPRSIDQLESYYRNLPHSSPLGRAFSEIAANERAQDAQEFAELAAKSAIHRAAS